MRAKQAKISIHRASLEAIGGEDAMNKAIADFQQALKDHALTVDVPAPTAHPWVEAVVRQSGGKYAIIEPEPMPVEVIPEKTFEELQAEAFETIKARRIRTITNGRVSLHGVKFAAGMDALTALMAADAEASGQGNGVWRARWRVGAGSFVLIDHNDVRTLIALARAFHQEAFTREYELSQAILSADTPKKLAKIDLESGWAE